MLRGGVYDEENKVIPEVLRKSYSDCDVFLGTKEMQQVLLAQSPEPSACTAVDKTVYQFQNLGLLDCSLGAHHLRTHERQDGDSEKLTRQAFVQEAEIMDIENEGLSDSEQDEVALTQRHAGSDDGACSSLYLEDSDSSETDGFCHTLPGHIQYSSACGGRWNHLGIPLVIGRSLTECDGKNGTFEPLASKRNPSYKAIGLFSNVGEGPNPDLAGSPGVYPGAPFGLNCEEEPTVVQVQAPAAAGGSLLEGSAARKTNGRAEILPESPDDMGNSSTGWRQGLPDPDMKEHFTDKLQPCNTSHVPVLAQEPQREHSHLEGTEYYSMAGDSGIDSPRKTHASCGQHHPTGWAPGLNEKKKREIELSAVSQERTISTISSCLKPLLP